jgi:hypothetical protein
MAKVFMFEHEQFNNGPVASDHNGMVVSTDHSIVDLGAFNNKMSSYKIDRQGQNVRVTFYDGVGFTGNSFVVPGDGDWECDNLNNSLLGGVIGGVLGTGHPTFNDCCRSVKIEIL